MTVKNSLHDQIAGHLANYGVDQVYGIDLRGQHLVLQKNLKILDYFKIIFLFKEIFLRVRVTISREA